MKKIYMSLVLIITSIFMISNVSAKKIAEAGENVTVDGNYSSLRIVAGNKVDNKSTNDGLSLMAASDLILEGESEYGFYAGRNVTVKETINKDLFIAGSRVEFDGSVIKRDLYLAGSDIILNASIGRDLNAGANVIDLSNAKINGNAYIDASKIIMNEGTEIKGILDYSNKAVIEGIDKAKINDVKIHVVEEKNTITPVERFTSNIIMFIGKYILLVVILLLLPTFKEELDVEDLAISNIFKNIGIGFTLLIMIPILCFFGIFTEILIPVSVITLICYFIAIYLAYLFVCYVIGNLVTTKVFKKDNLYLKAFVGLLIGQIISLLPGLGAIIIFLMILFGIGHYVKLIKKAS